MRILFFGEDESMRQMAESLTSVEAIHCDDFKETLEILKAWDKDRGDELEVFVVILDFSLGIKLLDKFSKKLKKFDGLYRCVLAESQNLKELKAYQKTKWACDGQLMAPISLQALQDIVEDFETVYYLDELGEDEADDVELTQLESEASKELDNLDEDKEDYDTTESNRVLPDEFRQASPNDQTASQEMSTLELPDQGLHDREAIFENNPTHKKIQQIFDQVFQYGKKSTPPQNNQELELPQADEEDEAPSQSEVSMTESKKEEVNVEFDLSDEDENDSNSSSSEDKTPEVNAAPSAEDDSDDGLEFDLSFDDADSEEVQPPTEDAARSQEFDFDDEEDEPLKESTEELLADDTGDMASGAASDSEADEAGGFEFDFDEQEDEGTENLGLSEAGEENPKNEKASEPESESSPGDLDFDEESDDGLSFELGGASDNSQEDSQKAETEEDEGFGDLDFSSESDDVDATKVATSSIKPAENQEQAEQNSEQDSGENTLDKVDKTISEIVMGDISAKSESDEDATGDFDLPDNLPEELTDDMLSEESTDSQDFAVDEWSDDDLSESAVGEETNPTVVTSSHQLKEEDKDKEKTPAGFELSDDDDDDDFDFSAVDAGDSDEELDKTVVQQSSSAQEVKPQQEKPEKEEVAAPAPKGLSAYAEDELTRLQSTIRQLREERDENHKQIQELKKEGRLIEQQGLSEKAELDELKIEISILKKRHKNELEELRYQLKLADEKKQIYEERCRNYQKEFERLNQKVRIEFNQVKQREKELESQLELVTMDTEAQVQSRDGKILELKRKIDSLEFNMENASIREQKSREDKARLEERLTKIMSTLRGSIQLLEDEDEAVDPSVDNNDTDEKI